MKNQNNEEEELTTKNIRVFLKTIETSLYKLSSNNQYKELTFTAYIGFRIYVNKNLVFKTKSAKIAIIEYNKLSYEQK